VGKGKIKNPPDARVIGLSRETMPPGLIDGCATDRVDIDVDDHQPPLRHAHSFEPDARSDEARKRLSACDLLEPPQRLDVIVEAADAVHGVEHHQVGAEPTPAVGRGRPGLRVRITHAQPALDAEALGVASERLELLSVCASGAMIGIQPSPSRAARVTAASDDPPNQIGIGRCTGGGTMLTSSRW
jgi:hypothetical protein